MCEYLGQCPLRAKGEPAVQLHKQEKGTHREGWGTPELSRQRNSPGPEELVSTIVYASLTCGMGRSSIQVPWPTCRSLERDLSHPSVSRSSRNRRSCCAHKVPLHLKADSADRAGCCSHTHQAVCTGSSPPGENVGLENAMMLP